VAKLVALFSLFGGLRKIEACAMRVSDVTVLPDSLLVKVPQSKTGPRSFVIASSPDPELDCLALFRHYMDRRAGIDNERLFLRVWKGQATKQAVGKNKLATYPREIATFLGIENPSAYTGHAFRRTAATWLADNGIDTINLKRFGGWKSDAIAQSYVADSYANKRSLANMLQGSVAASIEGRSSPEGRGAGTGVQAVNFYFTDCQFNSCTIGNRHPNQESGEES
jgi:integrase